MKSLMPSAVLMLLLYPLGVVAQTTVYAAYGMEVTNERGVFKNVNVGLLPSGKISDCRNQIDVCVFSLPANLQPMVNGKRLPDAYVLKQSGNWAPIYSAWYGLPSNDSKEICARLISGMRQNLTAEQADIKCLPPLGFARIK
jgi:hypothetical protein